MKLTRQIYSEEKDWYGTVLEDGSIGVNLQKLWEDTPNDDEDLFILNFSLTYHHELLHQLIYDLTEDEHSFREEEIIRQSLGEPWGKEEKKLYK